MTRVGREISNPRTGQRMTFLEVREALLLIDTINPVTDEREPLHVHPRQESGAELISGSLVFEVDGVQRKLAPGDSISIPANAPHRFWNDGDEDAHAIQHFRPALATADFFETIFALAANDELDARGMPRPLQLAVMVPEFENEIRPLSPPWPVLRTAAVILGPLARARGYRARVTA
jgi:mannose-6-phosphate isomerase-like protein (cupin superfamily)